MIKFTFNWRYIFVLALCFSHVHKACAEQENKKENITTEITESFTNKPNNPPGGKKDTEAFNVKRRDHEYFLEPPFFKLSPIRVPIIQNGVWIADLFCRVECEVEKQEDYRKIPAIFDTLVDDVYTTLYTTLGERFIVRSPLETDIWRPLLKETLSKYVPIKNLYLRQFCLVEYRNAPPTSALRTHTN